MIKPEELRIGNYLNNNGEILQVTALDCETVWHNGKWYDVSDNTLHPVPLSEEWLVKLGFEKRGYKKRKNSIRLSWQGYYDLIVRNEINDKIFTFTIKTNLYFGNFPFDKRNERAFIEDIPTYFYLSAIDIVWFKDTQSGNVKVEYVHQLQNLYFALTGEELAVREIVK